MVIFGNELIGVEVLYMIGLIGFTLTVITGSTVVWFLYQSWFRLQWDRVVGALMCWVDRAFYAVLDFVFGRDSRVEHECENILNMSEPLIYIKKEGFNAPTN